MTACQISIFEVPSALDRFVRTPALFRRLHLGNTQTTDQISGDTPETLHPETIVEIMFSVQDARQSVIRVSVSPSRVPPECVQSPSQWESTPKIQLAAQSVSRVPIECQNN